MLLLLVEQNIENLDRIGAFIFVHISARLQRLARAENTLPVIKERKQEQQVIGQQLPLLLPVLLLVAAKPLLLRLTLTLS